MGGFVAACKKYDFRPIMPNTDPLLHELREYHRTTSDARARGYLRDLRKEGHAYADWVEWLLRNGRAMTCGAWSPAEQSFIRGIGADFQARECFTNAQKALTLWWIGSGSKNQVSLVYCEGCVMVPALHGWLLLNGKVWDPTDEASAREVARLGEKWKSPKYYFGSEFPTAFMMRRIVENCGWVSVLDDGKAVCPVLRSDDWRKPVEPPTVNEVVRALAHGATPQ